MTAGTKPTAPQEAAAQSRLHLKERTMKRILFASAALVALTGAAFAQQSPVFQGNYSANVVETYDHDADNNGAGLMIGGERSASMRNFFGDIDSSLGIESDAGVKSGPLTGDLADREDNRGR
jgi:hypothetical protein